jgi:steroid delta-isomerase
VPDPAAIRATVEQYLERFNAVDRVSWLELFTPDATMEDPVGTPVRHGHGEIGAFFEQSHGLADTLRIVRTGPVRVAAGECAFPMQARPTMGGTEFVVDIIDVMTFDDDARITSMRAFWDATEMRPADSD